MLEGKNALVFGLANDKSIAWGIIQAFLREGANIGISYAGEIMEKRVKPLAERINCQWVEECDVTKDDQIEAVVKKAEKHFGFFALFISYWPQLVAGPIERPGDLQPQLKSNFDFDYERTKKGLIRILYGFFKKTVIADRLGLFVQAVYGQNDGMGGWNYPQFEHGGFPVIIATWFFAIQVYCDSLRLPGG